MASVEVARTTDRIEARDLHIACARVGYIRNVALRAAFLAAEEHSPLTQDHLERAIKAEFREIGKIADSGVLE